MGVPLNFNNPDAVFELVSSHIDDKKSIEELAADGIEVNILDVVLHPIYSILWITKARYKYVFGSKDNGKSKQGALWLITRWLANPNRCAVVLRKYANMNATSTLKDVIAMFKLLSKITGIKQLVPVSAEDYRRSGKKDLLYFTKTAPIELHNTVTGQIIHFTGLDRVAAGGMSLDDLLKAYDTIWAEELVDIEDNKIETMDDTTFDKWRVIESTMFRGTYEIEYDTDGNELATQKRREGLDWVDESILFTFNSHNPDHWLLREIGDKFVPLNPLDVKDCNDMEASKVRMFYDKDFQEGAGLLVMRTSVYINAGRDRGLVEQMRKDDFTTWAYLYLGATKAIGGLAYSGLESKIYTQQTDTRNMFPLSIGIDHANSPDHGDWFAASFLATDVIIDEMTGYGLPGYNVKYYYDEYGWNNKLLDFKDDSTFARELIEKLASYIENDRNWEQVVKNYGLYLTVDSSAASFMQTLIKEIYNYGLKNTHHIPWLSKLIVVPVEGKNTMVEIDGVMNKARKARVERNKRLLIYDMIIFDSKAYQTKREFTMTAYDLKMEVVDKHRDFVDAMDYAEMVNPIMLRFNQKLFYKENVNKNND